MMLKTTIQILALWKLASAAGGANISLTAGSGVDPEDTPVQFDQTTEPYFSLDDSIFSRVISVNVFKYTNWTLFHSNQRHVIPGQPSDAMKQVVTNLLQLQPSYITGLFILGSTDFIFGTAIDDYVYLRSAVLGQNPNCVFDLQLDALEYVSDSGNRLSRKLQYIKQLKDTTHGFNFEIIFFDHISQAYLKNAAVMRNAFRFIHETLNMAVGGNTYGGGIPPDIDFISLQTLNYQITNNMAQNRYNLPVIAKIIDTATMDMASESCLYTAFNLSQENPANPWKKLTDATRAQLVQTLASGQTNGKYIFSYPVLWPHWFVHVNDSPGLHTFNSWVAPATGTSFPTLFDYIKSLMDTYNPKSSEPNRVILAGQPRFTLNPKGSGKLRNDTSQTNVRLIGGQSWANKIPVFGISIRFLVMYILYL